MTIATDLGFVIGEEYQIVDHEHFSTSPGEYATFWKDDGSRNPEFKVGNRTAVYANITPDVGPVRVVPETRPAAPEKWTPEVGEVCSVDFVGNRISAEVVALFRSARYPEGAAVVAGPFGDTTHSLTRLSPIQPKQTVAELQAENRSIERQIARMNKRIERKRKYQRENEEEIERQLRGRK